MTFVNVVVDDHDVEQVLDRVGRAFQPAGMSHWMREYALPWIKQRTHDRFLSQGTDEGPWAPLAEATLEFRREQGYNPAFPINIRTTDMVSFLADDEGVVHPAEGGTEMVYPGPGSDLLEEKLRIAQEGGVSSGIVGDSGPPGTSVAVAAGTGLALRSPTMGTGKGAAPARPVLEVGALDAEMLLQFLSDWTYLVMGGGGFA